MHLISYVGKILFEPENKTKKHLAQASWKKVAMVIFNGDIAEYYSWFLKKRFNLELNKPLRGAHITFINDSIDDLLNRTGSVAEKEEAWNKLKEKWDGKEISVTLNLRPFSDVSHWWLIVDHKHRDELHAIRSEIGLGRPYFGLHMTIGYANEKNISHSKYINSLNDSGLIELNKDYSMDAEIHLKRISAERCDLYNSKNEMLGTLYNEYELNHVRIQIAKDRLEGYYVKWKNQDIPIESDGKIISWPEGFYDMQEKQISELFKLQQKIYENEGKGNTTSK
jgi:hypothetical protein